MCPFDRYYKLAARIRDNCVTNIEDQVRYANITIIEGHDASQYGIGILSARIAEIILGDQRAAIPVGSFQKRFAVTLSLPSIVGRDGVTRRPNPRSVRRRAGKVGEKHQ